MATAAVFSNACQTASMLILDLPRIKIRCAFVTHSWTLPLVVGSSFPLFCRWGIVQGILLPLHCSFWTLCKQSLCLVPATAVFYWTFTDIYVWRCTSWCFHLITISLCFVESFLRWILYCLLVNFCSILFCFLFLTKNQRFFFLKFVK